MIAALKAQLKGKSSLPKNTRAKVIAGLQDTKPTGVTGPIAFDEYGDPVNPTFTLYTVSGIAARVDAGHAVGDDGLAKPLSFDARYGAGVERSPGARGRRDRLRRRGCSGTCVALRSTACRSNSAEDAADLVAFFGA